MSYDEKCAALARHFLEKMTAAMWTEHQAPLAEAIQQSVEDYFNSHETARKAEAKD